jgi:hypothetical protein
LDHGGAPTVLLDGSDDTLILLRYDDKSPRLQSADGKGCSLVHAHIGLNPDYDNAASWQASIKIRGDLGGRIVLGLHNRDVCHPEKSVLMQNYPNPSIQPQRKHTP